MKIKKKLKQEPTTQDALKLRVLQVKAKLPKGINYGTICEYEFKIKDPATLGRIHAVWNLRLADEKITRMLETICDNIQNS